MDIKTIITAALVATICATGATFLIKKEAPALVGGGGGPDFITNYLSVGGVRTWEYKAAMANASTTCSFLSPAATSTLSYAGATITNSYGGTFDAAWGKAANAFSTTTSLGYISAAIASGAQGTFVASSTAVDIKDGSGVIAPSTYVNFKIGSSTPTLTGTCVAKFTEHQ